MKLCKVKPYLFGVLLLLMTARSMAATLMVMGDSLSAGYGINPEQGWVALMEKRLAEKGLDVSVVNASVSGETTSGGLSRLPELLKIHNPEIVLLELGANDGLRGTPLPLIEKNLQALVDLIQNSGALPVIIGTHLPPNYGPVYTRRFFSLFGGLAQERSLPEVSFLLAGVASNWDLMQRDGLHPTAEAQPLILNNVWAVVAPLVEH